MDAQQTRRGGPSPPRSIGNVLEWYDFAVYAYVAVDIAKKFFPQGDPDHRAAGDLPRLRARLRGPAARRHHHRPDRRHPRAQDRAADHNRPDGDRHRDDRPIADLRLDRHRGAAAAGGRPAAAGFLGRRRMGRLDRLHRRMGAGGTSAASTAASSRPVWSCGLLLGSGIAALVTTILTMEQMKDGAGAFHSSSAASWDPSALHAAHYRGNAGIRVRRKKPRAVTTEDGEQLGDGMAAPSASPSCGPSASTCCSTTCRPGRGSISRSARRRRYGRTRSGCSC